MIVFKYVAQLTESLVEELARERRLDSDLPLFFESRPGNHRGNRHELYINHCAVTLCGTNGNTQNSRNLSFLLRVCMRARRGSVWEGGGMLLPVITFCFSVYSLLLSLESANMVSQIGAPGKSKHRKGGSPMAFLGP